MHQKKTKKHLSSFYRHTDKAFTLIEIMVAITILSILLSMVQVVLISTINARDFVQAQTSVDRMGERLLSIMAQDIHAAYIYELEEVCFSGRSLKEGDRLDLITNTDTLLDSEDKKSDLCEVSYYLKTNPQELGSYRLMRREDFFIDDRPLDGGYSIKLYDRVAVFQLRYLDPKGTLKKSWNSKDDGGLPRAVIITLGLYSAPKGSSLEILQKSIRNFNVCVPILVSSQIPKKKPKKPEDKPTPP
ncbi:MAG: prepilin-type N-terminal cleavage/methylation domain-containing protein [Candidatus Brocadiae bacterium]|nr:prepilin-type N-terminal cleavage/methylation domain-containing protein [Candidatus Brocadiia bacterium]